MKDSFIKEKFGEIKFGEESSICYSDYERSFNSYLKNKGTPRYSHYIEQRKKNGKYLDEFEEGFNTFLS